ncbi:MAG: DNA adenine methylase [Elusimicrobia bacterium]|nr:DNA adenine methylase [Candidatus Liberimonas magnetica]
MQKITHKRNHKFHYSPLRYPGGKTFLFPLFDNLIKESGFEKVTYVEPFAGGSGAALALLFLEKVDQIVINDLDKAIYSFWKSAIYDSEKFIIKLFSIPITIREWKKQKLIYKNPRSGQFELGFATFYLNRTNISGILDGGPIGGMHQNGKWKINARFNKEALAEKIHQLSLYKNRISVCNKDGIELIKEYLDKKNTFIYLDPPYFEKGAMLYLNHYKAEDHQALAEILNKNPKAIWLLTYDNKKEIKSLYSERKIVNYCLNYNAYESRMGKEIMILSDTLAVRV